MRQFHSIEKLDTGILYSLELASRVSVLLLAFGLIASMVNVLTKGSVLSDSAVMRQIWAWTQCIAIDASVAGTIIRTFHYHHEGEKVKTWLYGLLSILLLFTAAIVSNIEATQQVLNVTLEAAYLRVFVATRDVSVADAGLSLISLPASRKVEKNLVTALVSVQIAKVAITELPIAYC